ncbi:EthD family reductase [Blastococcus sp. CT_GayMR20]|uniref:EthD family reductase n=1 Tax=Blastococcus sp. CT_GayMR20 TaxID=2559609 RepID=UPI001073D94B|nr:EthD family reductase [Blastococcus sp. CT_GayMR20]TFV92933.1 EthD family reductase [Blastococcus sp. CT_GayMR20]
MATTITVIYDNPRDPRAFEAAFPEQVALARKLPGLLTLSSATVWPKEDGSPTPALVDLHFADYATASAAVTSAEAGAFFPSVSAPATGGVRIVFAEAQEV